jgi:hypothetical protein
MAMAHAHKRPVIHKHGPPLGVRSQTRPIIPFHGHVIRSRGKTTPPTRQTFRRRKQRFTRLFSYDCPRQSQRNRTPILHHHRTHHRDRDSADPANQTNRTSAANRANRRDRAAPSDCDKFGRVARRAIQTALSETQTGL